MSAVQWQAATTEGVDVEFEWDDTDIQLIQEHAPPAGQPRVSRFVVSQDFSKPSPHKDWLAVHDRRSMLAVDPKRYLTQSNDQSYKSLGPPPPPPALLVWREAGRMAPLFPAREGSSADVEFNACLWRTFRRRYDLGEGVRIRDAVNTVSETSEDLYPLRVPPASKIGLGAYSKYLSETRCVSSASARNELVCHSDYVDSKFLELKQRSVARIPRVDVNGKFIPAKLRSDAKAAKPNRCAGLPSSPRESIVVCGTGEGQVLRSTKEGGRLCPSLLECSGVSAHNSMGRTSSTSILFNSARHSSQKNFRQGKNHTRRISSKSGGKRVFELLEPRGLIEVLTGRVTEGSQEIVIAVQNRETNTLVGSTLMEGNPRAGSVRNPSVFREISPSRREVNDGCGGHLVSLRLAGMSEEGGTEEACSTRNYQERGKSIRHVPSEVFLGLRSGDGATEFRRSEMSSDAERLNTQIQISAAEWNTVERQSVHGSGLNAPRSGPKQRARQSGSRIMRQSGHVGGLNIAVRESTAMGIQWMSPRQCNSLAPKSAAENVKKWGQSKEPCRGQYSQNCCDVWYEEGGDSGAETRIDVFGRRVKCLGVPRRCRLISGAAGRVPGDSQAVERGGSNWLVRSPSEQRRHSEQSTQSIEFYYGTGGLLAQHKSHSGDSGESVSKKRHSKLKQRRSARRQSSNFEKGERDRGHSLEAGGRHSEQKGSKCSRPSKESGESKSDQAEIKSDQLQEEVHQSTQSDQLGDGRHVSEISGRFLDENLEDHSIPVHHCEETNKIDDRPTPSKITQMPIVLQRDDCDHLQHGHRFSEPIGSSKMEYRCVNFVNRSPHENDGKKESSKLKEQQCSVEAGRDNTKEVHMSSPPETKLRSVVEGAEDCGYVRNAEADRKPKHQTSKKPDLEVGQRPSKSHKIKTLVLDQGPEEQSRISESHALKDSGNDHVGHKIKQEHYTLQGQSDPGQATEKNQFIEEIAEDNNFEEEDSVEQGSHSIHDPREHGELDYHSDHEEPQSPRHSGKKDQHHHDEEESLIFDEAEQEKNEFDPAEIFRPVSSTTRQITGSFRPNGSFGRVGKVSKSEAGLSGGEGGVQPEHGSYRTSNKMSVTVLQLDEKDLKGTELDKQ